MAAKERIDRKTKTITALVIKNTAQEAHFLENPDFQLLINRDRKIAIPRCWIPHVNALIRALIFFRAERMMG
jgi:hypothetical protein